MAAEGSEVPETTGTLHTEASTTSVRKKLTKPERPDVDAKNTQIDKLQAQITDKRNRIAELSSLIDGRKSKRGSPEQQAARTRIAELRQQFDVKLQAKQRLKEDLEAASKARDALRTQMKQMKTKLPYTTVGKIDEQIAKLEDKLQHTSLSLAEEKKTVEDVKKLRESRSVVQQYSERHDQMLQDDDLRDKIWTNIKGLDEELNSIKTLEAEQRNKLTAIMEKDNAESADLSVLYDERGECYAVIKAAREAINTIRDEFQAKWDEFKAQNQEWFEQRKQVQAEQRAKRQEEWEEKQARRREQEKESAGEPYYKEVMLCDQLLNYLRKFQTSQQAEVKAAVQSLDAPEGMVVVKKKKENQELDSWFAGLGGKGKGKGKKGKAESKKEGTGEAKITHSLDILDAFSRLKVEVPVTASKAAASVDIIKERKEYYIGLQAKAKEAGTAEGLENGSSPEGNEEEVAIAQPDLVADEAHTLSFADPTPAEAAAMQAGETLPDITATESVESESVVDSEPTSPIKTESAAEEEQEPPVEGEESAADADSVQDEDVGGDLEALDSEVSVELAVDGDSGSVSVALNVQ